MKLADRVRDQPQRTWSHSDRLRLGTFLSKARLNLIIMPTEKCNCACFYCYETFEKGRMSRPVIEGLKALITDRAPDLEYLELSWFGGEPLVAKEVIFEVGAHVLALQDQWPPAASQWTDYYQRRASDP